MLTAERIMALLNLEPLAGEGGFFRRTYTGPEMPGTTAAGLPGGRAISGAIYYLLFDEHFSAMHRLRTDEVYHFYLGDPVELLLLHPDGVSQVINLGSDLEAGQQVQFVVPAGTWQGSRVRPGGRLDPAWERAARDALADVYRRAARPLDRDWIARMASVCQKNMLNTVSMASSGQCSRPMPKGTRRSSRKLPSSGRPRPSSLKLPGPLAAVISPSLRPGASPTIAQSKRQLQL